MVKNILIIITIFFGLRVTAQNTTIIDSLKQVINTTKEDTSKIFAYINWGMEVYMQNPDTALILWHQAKELAEKKLIDKNPEDVEYALQDHLASSLNNIGSIYDIRGDNTSALEYYTKSMEISKKLGDKDGIALSYGNIGYIYSSQGDKDKALEYYFKSLNINKELNDKGGMIYALNNIGFVFQHQGDNVKALEYYEQSLKISEEIKDDNGIAMVLNNIAYTYKNLGDIPNALNYHTRALEKNEEIGDINGIAICLNNMGYTYHIQEDTLKALEYYKKAIGFFEKIGNKEGIATSYNNIGVIYQDEADNALIINDSVTANSILNLAKKYYTKALDIRDEIQDKKGLAVSMINIGNIYLRQANFNESKKDSLINKAYESFLQSLNYSKEINDKAEIAYALYNLAFICQKQHKRVMFEKYATKAYSLSKELGYPKDIERAASLMKELSIKQNNFKKAYEYYNEEILMRDSVRSEKNYKETQKQQARYEYEKHAAVDSIAHVKEIELKDIDIARIEEEKKAQAAQRNMFIIGFALVLVLAVYIFRSYRQKKKANILLAEQNEEIMQQKEEIIAQNDHILQQKEEIETQRDLVVEQKEEIELIHHEISQSIDYATRLQSSILPEKKVLEENISDLFVFFMPKDKVSGDFYWWTKIENHMIITVADCTGHGVPGAFMSMLGMSFLREIVLKEYITHPGVILRKLRKEIINALKQKGEVGGQKDGMDMALISINLDTYECQFAGANNPLYLIRNGEFTEIKGDKMPIAIYEKMDSYTNHELQLHTGDLIYMFSDGFADQFGGPKGKKFKYKPFKKLLTSNAKLPMQEQFTHLNNTFTEWKADYEQIDDIAIVGIKI